MMNYKQLGLVVLMALICFVFWNILYLNDAKLPVGKAATTRTSTAATAEKESKDDVVVAVVKPSSLAAFQEEQREALSSLLSSSSFKSSPACRPTWHHPEGRQRRSLDKISRLFFAHTRKAGGSTIRKFVQCVAEKYNWTLVVHEGGVAEDPTTRNDTFYVTNLREPVERAISHFKFEGRWHCQQMTSNKTFLATQENSNSLEDFIAERFPMGRPNPAQCSNDRRKMLWRCAQNCYLRWFGEPFNCLRDPQQSWKSALDKLMGYNLIFVTEFMTDPEYLDGISQMLDMDPKILRNKRGSYCSKDSKYWNKVNPPILKNSTMKELKQLNTLDRQLYHKISTCPNGVEFPDFDPRYVSG